MRTLWVFAACLAALLPASGQNSHAGPQLTGFAARRAAFAAAWQLDLKRSKMGADHPGPGYAFTKTVELKGSALMQKDHEVNVDIVGFAMPERDSTAELVPDAREHTVERPGFFPGMPPTPTHVAVEWQGDNLIVSESSQSFIGAMTTSRRYYLSDDCAELVELVVGRTQFGDSEQRLLFTRVSESH